MGFQVTELYKKYGDKVVVDHLSFKMDQPSVYALLGTNGAGKTTSIRMILNMLAKDGGIVQWNGGPLTLEMHDTVFNHPEGLEKVAQLVRSFILLGGHQLQLNTVSKEVLLDAQAHPENYKTLVVRVAGYSALFTTLSRSLQDDIINRTEQGF